MGNLPAAPEMDHLRSFFCQFFFNFPSFPVVHVHFHERFRFFRLRVRGAVLGWWCVALQPALSRQLSTRRAHRNHIAKERITRLLQKLFHVVTGGRERGKERKCTALWVRKHPCTPLLTNRIRQCARVYVCHSLLSLFGVRFL